MNLKTCNFKSLYSKYKIFVICLLIIFILYLYCFPLNFFPKIDAVDASAKIQTNGVVEKPCGVADIASISATDTVAPSNPVHQFAGGNYHADSFKIFHNPNTNIDEIYVLSSANERVYIYNLSDGSLTTTIILLSGVAHSSMGGWSIILDDSGNVYIQYGANNGIFLAKIDRSNNVIWTAQFPDNVDGMYRLDNAGTFRFGVVRRSIHTSILYDTDGNQVGTNSISGAGKSYNDAATGDLYTTDSHYVTVYNSSGTLINHFGSLYAGNDFISNGGRPFHFYQQGQAIKGPDNNIYVADGGFGIYKVTNDGLFLHNVSGDTLNRMTESPSLEYFNGKWYFTNGGGFNNSQSVAWISDTDLQTLMTLPAGAEPGFGLNPGLGFGAGLESDATYNYYSYGQTSNINISFDPWWSIHSLDMTGEYTIRERKDILTSQSITTHTFNIPNSNITSLVNIPMISTQPGFYQVEAKLKKNNVIISAECMYVTIGVQGAQLNFSTLPAGADYGGPGSARGVALAGELGFKLSRVQLDWNSLLPGGASSNAALNFSNYDSQFQSAQSIATAAGVVFSIQVGQGGQIEKDLVSQSKWANRITELVNHYKAAPYNIHNWMVWNEPNAGSGYAGGDVNYYTNNVLKPFYNAAKAADPNSVIVGGNILGMDLNYWTGIADAGGLDYMDVAGIHPYSGHNRGFEEQGLVQKLIDFKALMASYNKSGLQIWDTEQGWWSGGVTNLYSQASKVARKKLLYDQLGVSNWYYFIYEGGFDAYLSVSLIEQKGNFGYNYVKPAALASMTYNSKIGTRHFIKIIDTVSPHTHALLYGNGTGSDSSSNVLALWSEDISNKIVVNVPGQTSIQSTDLLGKETTLSLTGGKVYVDTNADPQYLKLNTTTDPILLPYETFGTNLSLSSNSSTATASSSGASNPASKAIDGIINANDGGDYVGTPSWASNTGDNNKYLQVTFNSSKTIDRILLMYHSPDSVVANLRDYEIQTLGLDGTTWSTIETVSDNLFENGHIFTFTPKQTTAYRIKVNNINYSGNIGGPRPWFASTTWDIPAVIYETESYAPGTINSIPVPTSIPSTNTVIPTSTSIPITTIIPTTIKFTTTITPTLIPSITIKPTSTSSVCLCQVNACSNSCTFNKLNGVNYNVPISCNNELNNPTQDEKNSYCTRVNRTSGDSNGDNIIESLDYMYYVRIVNGGIVPLKVNADFNGDGVVSVSDRNIIVKSLISSETK